MVNSLLGKVFWNTGNLQQMKLNYVSVGEMMERIRSGLLLLE